MSADIESSVVKYQSAGRCFPVFPKGPAAVRQGGRMASIGPSALGAKGCIEGVHRFAQGVVGAFKNVGRQYDKTFTTGLSPVGKQANRPSGEGNAPLLVLRTTSPGGGSLLYTTLGFIRYE